MDTRTLLEEYAPEGEKTSLEELSYSIIAHRLSTMGGNECRRIVARKIGRHYLLERVNVIDEFSSDPFDIVDDNLESVVRDLMYNEAKNLAEEIAKNSNNKVIDLTSRGKKITGDDRYYVPQDYWGRCDWS